MIKKNFIIQIIALSLVFFTFSNVYPQKKTKTNKIQEDKTKSQKVEEKKPQPKVTFLELGSVGSYISLQKNLGKLPLSVVD
jgi:hypothetical protein